MGILLRAFTGFCVQNLALVIEKKTGILFLQIQRSHFRMKGWKR